MSVKPIETIFPLLPDPKCTNCGALLTAHEIHKVHLGLKCPNGSTYFPPLILQDVAASRGLPTFPEYYEIVSSNPKIGRIGKVRANDDMMVHVLQEDPGTFLRAISKREFERDEDAERDDPLCESKACRHPKSKHEFVNGEPDVCTVKDCPCMEYWEPTNIPASTAEGIKELKDALNGLAVLSRLNVQNDNAVVYIVKARHQGAADLAVFLTLESAKQFVEKRYGVDFGQWDKSDAHGEIHYYGPNLTKQTRDKYTAWVTVERIQALPLDSLSSGPGSPNDKMKALLQLEARFTAYPNATGYSHLAGLVIRDAIIGREYDGARLVKLIQELSHDDMRFLWDLSRELWAPARAASEKDDEAIYIPLVKKASEFDRIREIIVSLREKVTEESLSYPDKGGVLVRKAE